MNTAPRIIRAAVDAAETRPEQWARALVHAKFTGGISLRDQRDIIAEALQRGAHFQNRTLLQLLQAFRLKTNDYFDDALLGSDEQTQQFVLMLTCVLHASGTTTSSKIIPACDTGWSSRDRASWVQQSALRNKVSNKSTAPNRTPSSTSNRTLNKPPHRTTNRRNANGIAYKPPGETLNKGLNENTYENLYERFNKSSSRNLNRRPRPNGSQNGNTKSNNTRKRSKFNDELGSTQPLNSS